MREGQSLSVLKWDSKYGMALHSDGIPPSWRLTCDCTGVTKPLASQSSDWECTPDDACAATSMDSSLLESLPEPVVSGAPMRPGIPISDCRNIQARVVSAQHILLTRKIKTRTLLANIVTLKRAWKSSQEVAAHRLSRRVYVGAAELCI